MPTTILCQQPFRHLFLHLVPRNIRKHRSPESGARRDAWNVSSLFLFLTLLLWKLWKVSTLETPERQRILESDQQKVHFRYAKVFSLDVLFPPFFTCRGWKTDGEFKEFCWSSVRLLFPLYIRLKPPQKGNDWLFLSLLKRKSMRSISAWLCGIFNMSTWWKVLFCVQVQFMDWSVGEQILGLAANYYYHSPSWLPACCLLSTSWLDCGQLRDQAAFPPGCTSTVCSL